ncbi:MULTISPECIES: BREX-2 system adenine-specific DNA-methyltransferase PglX [unclassified Microbacterium]|uniref:BREX-2 system adenine-specific DNA-methyltransferase PglX n=1 Tax=unclassified Microbacterium TaxID=2609290 RepID=UPI003016D004
MRSGGWLRHCPNLHITACGSGHFLLGAFERLMSEWSMSAPGLDKGDRAQRALDSIHGVDLNPFAIAIARFRLTVAAIKAAGITTLVAAPAFRYHLAIGDSLLGGQSPEAKLDMGDGEYFAYQTEDLQEHANILAPGQYHVVVANPPYIQPPDARLRDTYRALYSTCHGKYALSVPFMELLFRLAKQPDAAGGAGHVGQITSNSFMKREFGKKLIEQFLSGKYTGSTRPSYVDLSHIIDTSGAYIPGHGTPTVILVGRPRKPMSDGVRAVLGVRGEPGQPAVPARGLVWTDIAEHVDEPGYDGNYVTVTDVPRETYAVSPWSLSGGGAGELKDRIDAASSRRLSEAASEVGIMAVVGEEEAFEVPSWYADATMPIVAGEAVRDYSLHGTRRFWPYDEALHVTTEARESRWMWPFKQIVSGYVMFGKTRVQRGLEWFEYGMLAKSKLRSPLTIAFAFVATHNHFALDRGLHVFGRTAPVIKLPADATEDDHFDLLGVLNSSTACFWLKQVSHNKGGPGGGSSKDEKWRDFYEFTATKLQEFPLPEVSLRPYALRIDELARESAALIPSAMTMPDVSAALRDAHEKWSANRGLMIALQEELDWAAYAAYGLTELAPRRAGAVTRGVVVGQRPVEIALARKVASGELVTRWFDEFAEVTTTDVPQLEDTAYVELIEARLAEIEKDPAIRLLETPDFKRKWETPGWDRMVADAVRAELLGRLESAEIWVDGSGRPLVRSAAQVADELRRDERVRELMTIHAGSQDFDLTTEIGKLLSPEAVPPFAPLRYKPAGIEKFRAWERTWDLQRAEDRGERVDVPVPPKYAQGDFLKPTYWTARAKLDVPKERFLSFPGARLPDDATELYGWAGWDHSQRGQAIARLAGELSRAGAPDEQVVPLVGALIELQPWLDQWYGDIDARSGVSPASAVSAATTALLGRLDMGADTVLAWRPAPATRGRKKS